jgi:hypothetical protein
MHASFFLSSRHRGISTIAREILPVPIELVEPEVAFPVLLLAGFDDQR